MSDKIAVVLGVGPGLGTSVAHRFADEGYTIVPMARSRHKLKDIRASIEEKGGSAYPITCDATDPVSVAEAFETIRREVGSPEVLVYNAGAFKFGGILELDPETFEECWKTNCYGGFLAAREVLPDMADDGQGTIIFTGATASTRGSANFAGLAVGKFGLRALAQSMAREFGPDGIHVAHVVIDGQIDTPRVRDMTPDRPDHTFLNPDAIAEEYWRLHTQDRSTWTLEMDLRPHVEDF